MGSPVRGEAPRLSALQVSLLGHSKAKEVTKRKYDVANCPICGSEVRIYPDASGAVRPWTLTEPSDPEDILDVSTIECEAYHHPVNVFRNKAVFKTTDKF